MSNEVVLVARADLLAWAKEWQAENDPGDDTDCVTPFDKYLYGTSGESMTTETSNAREPFAYVVCDGRDVTSCAELQWPRQLRKGPRGAKAAWRDLPPGIHPLYLAPPAAARGDVRGLVAKWRERGDDEIGDAYSGPWYECAHELEAALAAEGVQCETCDDSKAVVTYVDPYERGDVSSPEQSPCPDCAEGVQAGEASPYDLAVLDDAAETLDRIGEGSAGLREARARIASSLSQQPEARGVVDAEKLAHLIREWELHDKTFGHDGRHPLIADFRALLPPALTGERNG